MPNRGALDSEFWRILSSHTVYNYPPFVRLEKQVVQLPDGKQVDDYHWLEMPDFCLICPYTIDERIVTLRGYRHGVKGIASFLPGGHVEGEEAPINSAKRELIEETGYQSDSWRSMGSYIPHSNYGCGRVHLFHAKDAIRVQYPNSGDLEDMSVELVESETILSWIRDGRIPTLASVAAIVLSMKGVF